MSAPLRKMGRRMGGFTQKATRGLSEANRAAGRLMRGMHALGRRVTAVAAASAVAFAAVGRNVVKAGADFEQAITNVGAVGLKARGEIKALEAEALRLGATTKFTATEAAQGMELLAKAGFETKDILLGIGPVLSAAAASGGELAETAGHVSDVLKGMGLDTRNASRVADVLAKASSRTNSTIGSLAESMANVSSTARKFKIPLEDVVASVALLQDVGLDASVSGSALNTMLTKLAKPSKGIAREMQKLGIAFQDQRGDMLPLPAVLASLAAGMDKAGGNMAQVAFLADMVGLRGQKAATNLADLAKSGKLAPLVKELKSALGTSQKMAALRMDTLSGDLLLLEASVDAVKVALFDTQNGPLRKVVQSMTEWVAKNKDVIASGVVKFLERLDELLPSIVTWTKRLAIVFGSLYVGAAAVRAYAAAVKIAALATAVLNGTMAVNPVGLWIMGIAAAVGLIVAFWPEISEFFKNVWAGMKIIGEQIVDAFSSAISAVWDPVKRFIVANAEWIAGVMTLIVEGFAQMFEPQIAVVKWAVGQIVALWGSVGAYLGGLWDGIVEIGAFAVEKLVGLATWYVDTVKSVFSGLYDFFAGLWSWIWTEAKRVLGPILAVIDKVRGVGGQTLGTGGPGAAGGTQVVSPHERTAKSVYESTYTEKSEVTIKAPRGTAEITKRPRSGGGPRLQPSGAF